MFKRSNASLASLFIYIFLLSSCISTKKSAYFTDQQNAVLPSVVTVPETVIESNDILSISVSSLSADASAVFNSPNNAAASIANANSSTGISSGYLVNADGNIQFPVLGTIKAAGLTENGLRLQIVKDLTTRKLLLDPIVSIRHLNFKVTVLGEVRNPTVVTVPSEKITLLEALGLAGDITIYGKKDNVMIIRDETGQRTITRMNLNSTEIFNSPYYYLKASDIVYVEPNKARVASATRASQSLPIILSALSFAAIIIDRVTR